MINIFKKKVPVSKISEVNPHWYYIDRQYFYFEKRLETIKNKQIVFLGDSIFNMFCVENLFNAINFGISGESAFNMSKRISFLEKLNGLKIVLGIGINDVGNYDTKTILDSICSILSIIKINNEVIISSILPIQETDYKNKWNTVKTNSQIKEINDTLSNITMNRNGGGGGVIFCNSGKYLKNTSNVELNTEYTIGDGLHLSVLVYNRLYMALKEVL